MAEDLQKRLQENSRQDHQHWVGTNLRATHVRGVPMHVIRHIVEEWTAELPCNEKQCTEKIVLELLMSPYIEDKLAGMVYLEIDLIPSGIVDASSLTIFEKLFMCNFIQDSKTCDHFASKVLKTIIQQCGTQVTRALGEWMEAENIWQARAALSGLSSFARDGLYGEIILKGCRKVILRKETAAKNVVASTLHAVEHSNRGAVVAFFKDENMLTAMSASGLTTACQRLGDKGRRLKEKRKLLLQLKG